MTIDNNATLKLSSIRFYKAPVGTARPTGDALRSPSTPWDEIGNTSLENIFTMTSEGGEKTTLGSAQNHSLRDSITPLVESVEIDLLEWNQDGLVLYYGANTVIASDGAIEVPTTPTPTEAAFLAVIFDGEKTAGFYIPKGSIFRRDNIAISDTESLSALPISVTALAEDGAASALTVIPLSVPDAAPTV